MAKWAGISGETPIDRSGLKKKNSVTNRQELAAVEARNIADAFLKYLACRPSPRSAPFDYAWFLRLHVEMFGDVWAWAGVVRNHDLNIGVAHFQIVGQLAALVDDLASWSGFGHSLELQAVWLHHKAVWIHPFENGNGRWARLLANIWLKRHGERIVAWPVDSIDAKSAIRSEYIAALKAADGGNHAGLLALHRRFTEDA